MEETNVEKGLDLHNNAGAQQEQTRSQMSVPTNINLNALTNEEDGDEVDATHTEDFHQEKKDEGPDNPGARPGDQLKCGELTLALVSEKCAELETAHQDTMAVFSKVCEKITQSSEICSVTPTRRDDNVATCSDENNPEFEIHKELIAESVGDPNADEWTSCSDEDSSASDRERTQQESFKARQGNNVQSVRKLIAESTEAEEVSLKEKRHGRRRSSQVNKQIPKRLPRAALTAIFDAVDSVFGGTGSNPPTGGSGSRGFLRGSALFSPSRRSGAAGRTPNTQEAHLSDEAAAESDLWSPKRLSAVVAAIDTRLENVDRIVQCFRTKNEQSLQNTDQELKSQLSEIEKRIADILPLLGDQKFRPGLQARVELITRWLLKLREVLNIHNGSFSELDVQMALTRARRHLRVAQGAAAKLGPLTVTDE